MKLLEDRFGRPCQIVCACVDSLTKGPMIAPNDKQGLRKYADDTRVMYDTLNSMNCLGEMNADNLEKMILRLPRWPQGKFAEYLKKIERGSSTMPTIHNIVDFLKDRADVAFTLSSVKHRKVMEMRKFSKVVKGTVVKNELSLQLEVIIVMMFQRNNCVQCATIFTHCIVAKFSSRSLQKSEASLLSTIESVSIVLTQKSISHEHATLLSVAEVLDAANLTIHCYT